MASTESAEMLRRVVVGLKRYDQSDAITLANFTECIVNYFAPSEISARVSCKLQDNMLVLSSASQPDAPNIQTMNQEGANVNGCDLESVILQHSPECPVLRLPEFSDVKPIPENVLNRGIHVGVAVVTESSDGRILLTQRSDHMRAFPRAWVPPGGNLEFGENIAEGGLRELEEESGLKFDANTCDFRVLCLWESVYPVFLSVGSPRSHHVVVYLHMKSTESWEKLLMKMKLDPGEVQACTWLTEDDVTRLFAGGKEQSAVINRYIASPNGSVTQSSELDLTQMFPSSLWQQNSIYSGTQLALRRWLDYHKRQTKIALSKI